MSLCDVSVELEIDDSPFVEGHIIPCELLTAKSIDEPQHIFVSFEFDQEQVSEYLQEGPIEMAAMLKFVVKECAEEDLEYEEGYEDEYMLNSVEFELRDFVKPLTTLKQSEFKKKFQSLPKENQVKRKFNLSLETLPLAVNAVVEKLGLGGVEYSHQNVTADVPQAMVDLAGQHISGSCIYARSLFKQSKDRKGTMRVLMQIGVTSDDAELPAALLACIR